MLEVKTKSRKQEGLYDAATAAADLLEWIVRVATAVEQRVVAVTVGGVVRSRVVRVGISAGISAITSVARIIGSVFVGVRISESGGLATTGATIYVSEQTGPLRLVLFKLFRLVQIVFWLVHRRALRSIAVAKLCDF